MRDTYGDGKTEAEAMFTETLFGLVDNRLPTMSPASFYSQEFWRILFIVIYRMQVNIVSFQGCPQQTIRLLY